jgi:alkaline phosphatase
VILIVADGAGVAHWSLAVLADSNLAIGRMGTVGLVDTRGSDHVVTGSAPGATALSTGVRTFMGAIAVGPDSAPHETVLEAAAARGMATGLITTTFIVDATPASFAAHVPSRGQLAEIASQMGEAGVNVMMGGGRLAFLPTWRPDSVDLLGQLQQRYSYVETAEDLQQLDTDTVTSLLGLFAERDMGIAAERPVRFADMVSAAIAVLDNDPDGFFLMIESEESDTRAHQNVDEEILVTEMLEIDEAVRLALDYQERHPETLVVVTSDHETGGITLPHDQDRNVVMQYSTQSHTGALVPLFASGPWAERFGGLLENWEVGQLLLQAVR